MKIELSPRAEADIIRQFRYYLVVQDAPVTAVRFHEAVKDGIRQLKPHPRIGSVLRSAMPGLRSWPVRVVEMIRIYYLLAPDALRVVRVLHGKRDVRRILKQEALS